MAKSKPGARVPDESTSAASAEPDSASFAVTLARLQQVVERLESDGPELDEALRLFEEGISLLRRAEGTLNSAEQRIRLLVGDEAAHLEEWGPS